MLPPTLHTLRELAQYPDIDTLMAASAARDVSVPVRPIIQVDPDGAWMKLA